MNNPFEALFWAHDATKQSIYVPPEVLEAMTNEPAAATGHADRWILLGLKPGEYRDRDGTIRRV